MRRLVCVSIVLATLSYFSSSRATAAEFNPADHPEYHFTPGNPPKWELQDPPIQRLDPDLGLVNTPSRRVHHVLRTKTSVIWDTYATHDEFGYRVVQQDHLPRRKRFLAMMGCSFVYGTGLQDGETLPYLLAQQMPQYRVYNFGIGGTGPNTMLAQIQEAKTRQILHEQAGIFVYVGLAAHVGRANGFYQESSWLSYSPDYEYDPRGELVRDGSFRTAHPWRIRAYDWLRWLQGRFFPSLNFNWPPLRARHLDYVCDLAATAAREVHSRYPGSKFVVVSHPLHSLQPEIVDCMRKKGLDVIVPDISYRDGYKIPGEGHPSALFNRDFSKILAGEIDSYSFQ